MILENTPYWEVMRTIKDEMEKVSYFVNKTNRLGFSAVFNDGANVYYKTYTHPQSKNTYMYWGGRIVTPVRFTNLHGDNYRSGFCLLVNTSDGGRMVYCTGKMNDEGKKVDSLLLYTSHFFKRYRERAGLPDNMPTNELICNYFNRNTEYMPLDYKQVSRRDDADGTALQNYDGVTLGRVMRIEDDGYEFIMVKNNTFLPQSMLKPNQTDALMDEDKIQAIIAENMREIVKNHPVLSKYQ